MAVHKAGRGLVITGLAGIVLALLATILLPGDILRPFQILAIEISLSLIVLGLWLARTERAGDNVSGNQVREAAVRVLDSPIPWVFAGFLLIYLLLFIGPLFLNPGRQMVYLTGYIPNLNPIGNDMRVMIELIEGWVAGNQSPYTIQFYPPLTYIFFAPFLLVRDPLALYRVFSLFTFISYCLLALYLPLKMVDRKYLSLIVLLFVTGLFSYGLQFELERGQYNVFTFLLCLASIYIFHYHPKYRLLAFLLFSLSVQLKLYPAIFIVMFVDDWRDWKTVLRRFAGIGLFNAALFFVMGYQTFLDFIRSVTAQVVSPSWIGVWNHSISSFISMAKQDGFGLVSLETLRTFRQNAESVEVALLLAFFVFFLSALLLSALRKRTGLDPYLLLACAIGALILPISYDYTLSLLVAPMALFFSGISETIAAGKKLLSALIVFAISVAYFSLLIPYNYRPYFLQNSFPLLFLIFVLSTLLNLIRFLNDREQRRNWQGAAP
jgi:hypothetical protein